MNSDRFPIPQLENESNRAYECFLVYCELGTERTIDKAFDKYNQERIEDGSKRDRHSRIRTRADGSWYEWASRHQWVERAAKYDQWKRDRDFAIVQKAIATSKEKAIKEMFEAFNNSFRVNVKGGDALLSLVLRRIRDEGATCSTRDLKLLAATYRDATIAQKQAYDMWMSLVGLEDLIECSGEVKE